jgi:DNA-directed RNA polymerase subunit M/transcription elongation factor TFIIS
MDTFDPGGAEFLRMAERYRRMSDGELLALIPQSSELKPFAQEALANEVRSRGLKAEVEDEKPATPSQFKPSQAKPPSAFFEHESPKFRDSASSDFPGPNSPDLDSSQPDSSQPDSSQEDQYAEDRKPVELCTVWSERDALQLQGILDEAGIPFFMGPEKATGVDKVTSNFANGVGVQIMQIGIPWARQAMQRYAPEDDPAPKETPELDEVLVRCPKCHSDEVVFEGRTSELANARDESSQKFEWTCDSCGHHWEDDGVEKEE